MSIVKRLLADVREFFSDRTNLIYFLSATAAASVVTSSVLYFRRKKNETNPRKYWDSRYTQGKEREDKLLYGKTARKWLQEQELRLITLSKQHAPRRLQVLEIGAGQGQNGLWILKTMNTPEVLNATGADLRSAFKVHAMDISTIALQTAHEMAEQELGAEKAKEFYAAENKDIMEEDLGSNKYDVILCLFCQFTADHAKLHKKLARALRPGGYLILQGYRPKQLEYKTGGPKNVENLYTADDLRQEFGKDLLIIELKEHEEEMNDGEHKGISALVSMLATKSASTIAY